jgi:hypothetical protein
MGEKTKRGKLPVVVAIGLRISDFETCDDGILRTRCKRCRGLGWIGRGKDQWPDVCPNCGGRGRVARGPIAKRAKIARSTLDRFLHGEKMRQATAERVRARLSAAGFL